MLPKARIIGALALCAGLALSACTNPFAARPSPTSEVSIMAEGAVTAYPVPGTVVVPTAIPTPAAQATDPQAAVTQPTVAPGSETLVGPEWFIAYSGDLNADGRPDVVAYKAGGVLPGATFKRPEYSAYIGSASEAVIVQADATGKPQVLVSMSRTGISLGNRVAVTFPPSSDAARNPVALMILVGAAQPATISALPINAGGEPYTQAAGVRWNRTLGAYEIITGGK